MMPSPTSKAKLKHSWKFEAIGTRWSIETTESLGSMKKSITSLIDEFDQVYSRFRDDSPITALSKRAGEYHFPIRDKPLFELYRELYEATNGALSPLVGQLLENAGYDKTYSFHPVSVIPAPSWEDAMSWKGTQIHMKQPWTLDFGAAGKGYLIDMVCSLLERAGHEHYVVDASGDIRMKQAHETIGLENPFNPRNVIGAVTIQTGSICASATNRRVWGEWNHVIDPRNGKPVKDVVATWVIASTGMVADGLATALFFVTAEKLAQWDFEYLRLLSDGSIERSENFVGELYT